MEEIDHLPIPRPVRHRQVVYYLSGEGLGVVKIGTTNNMHRRFRAMMSDATGLVPKLLAWEYGDASRESQRQIDFGRDSRIRTDWFALTPRLRAHIEQLRREHPLAPEEGR